MTHWSDEEVFALLGIWAEEEIQALLEGLRRNQSVLERIAREMGAAGHSKTASQCKDKLKKLKTKYKKLKDGHDISGTNRHNWPFYDKMDEVLGTRHSVQPPITIDTSLLQQDSDDLGDEQQDEQPGQVNEPFNSSVTSTLSTTTAAIATNTTSPTSTITVSTSTSTANSTSTITVSTSTSTANSTARLTESTSKGSSSSLPSIHKKGKSPKKRYRKIDAMEKAMDRIVRLQEASDDRFLALEEKRLKLEETMMSSLHRSLNILQQTMTPYAYPFGPMPTPPLPGPTQLPPLDEDIDEVP